MLERASAFELRSPVPTFVYLFRSRRAYEPYALPNLGRPETISGYFARREDASFMAIAGGRRDETSATAFHEYVHDLLERGDAATEAITPLTAATRLAPTLGPAWSHLASALELGTGDVSSALAAARRAAKLMPADREVLIQLVRRAAAAGDLELAAATVHTARLPDPDDRRRLAATLVTSLANAATTALLADRPNDAEELLGAARAGLESTSSPALVAIVERVAAALSEARLAGRYNEAASLARAGDLTGAVALLDEILRQDPGPNGELRSACEDLRREPTAPPPSPGSPPAPAITRVSAGEVAAVNDAIARGDLDSAISLLAELDRRLDRGEYSWIDAKLAELRRARADNRFAAAYNQAVELYNQRRYREVVALLDDLLAGNLTPSAAAQATRLRARAAAANNR